MSPDEPEALIDIDAPLFSPSPVMLTGLAVTAGGWLWLMALGGSSPAGVVVLVVGLLLVGVGLAVYLSAPRMDDDSRLQTAGWWLLAAAAAVVGSLGLEQSADSMAMLLRVFALVSVIAAVLSGMSSTVRWVGLSLLVVWHFFAIYTATAIVAPPTGAPSWLATQIWTRVTRPYLQLTHLNNAYHFYAPEPGPVSLVWIRLRFADGAVVWVRIPDHEKCTNHIERRRMGSLATTLSQAMPIRPTEEQINERDEAAQRFDPVIPPRPRGMPIELQYRDPGQLGRMILTSMAKYLARTTAHPDGASAPVVAMRVYRGECSNPPVEDFQAGRDPLDPTLYRAWYLGEYDAGGNLIESSRKDMLYWMIPILREDRPPPAPALPGDVPSNRPAPSSEPWSGEGKVVNFLRIHAGDGNKEEMP